MGINRIRAADYFAENPGDMSRGMMDYAIAACKAKFGFEGVVKPATARLVRHKLTPECIDRAVPLENESCVTSCLSGVDYSQEK